MNGIDYNKTLDSEGLDYIILRYKEVYKLENVTFKLDEETGKYSFTYKNGDKEIVLGECDKDSTVAEAVTSLDDQYSAVYEKNKKFLTPNPYNGESGNSYGNTRRGLNRVKKSNPNPVNMNFDPEEFENVNTKLDQIMDLTLESSEIESISSDLTGKLRSWYDSQTKLKNHEVKNIKDHLDVCKKKINGCIDLINSTDDALKQLLVSAIDDIFSFSLVSGPIDENEKQRQKDEIQKMIDSSTVTLNKLKEYFQEKCFDLGIPLDIEFVNTMMPFLEALGLSFDSFSGNGNLSTCILPEEINNYNPRYLEGVEVLGLTADTIEPLLEDLEKYDVFNKVHKYLETGDFESTLYDITKDTYVQLGWANTIEDYEATFLGRFLAANTQNTYGASYFYYDSFDFSKNKKFVEYMRTSGNSEIIESLLWDAPSSMTNSLYYLYDSDRDEILSHKNEVIDLMKYMCTDEEGKYIDFVGIIKPKYDEYLNTVSDISTMDTYIKQLQNEQKMVEYNAVKGDPKYLEILIEAYKTTPEQASERLKYLREANGVDGKFNDLLPYLSTEEYALLNYYTLIGDKNKVNSYLNLLEDNLNQRKGLDEAVKAIMNNPNGFDRGEAFLDGIKAWLESVRTAITGGTRTTNYTEYKNMFIATILEAAKHDYDERGIYTDLLKDMSPTEGAYNKFAYTMWNQAGNMLIPVIIGAAVGIATGGAGFVVAGHTISWGALAGGVAVGLGAAGSAMGKAVSLGETNRLKVLSYGLLSGLSEAGFEMFIGSIPGLSAVFESGDIVGFKTFLKACIAEGKEEFCQTFVEAGWNALFGYEEFDLGNVTGEALTSAFYGFMMGAVFNGASVAIKYTVNGITYRISGDAAIIMETLSKNDGDASVLLNDQNLNVEFDCTEQILQLAEQNGKSNFGEFMQNAYYDPETHQLTVVMKDGTINTYNDVEIDMDADTNSDVSVEDNNGENSGKREADLGDKLDYIYGEGTGNKHNVDRTNQLNAYMQQIGLPDTPENRAYIEKHLNDVLNDPSSVVGTEEKSYRAKELPGQPEVHWTATIRESLLMGPNGGIKIITVWDGDRLITIEARGDLWLPKEVDPKSKWHGRYRHDDAIPRDNRNGYPKNYEVK